MSKRSRAPPVDSGFDFLAMLQDKSKSKPNMKELPAANKKGKITYFGYMDAFFGGRPPIPLTNVVIDNSNLQIIRDLTTEM